MKALKKFFEQVLQVSLVVQTNLTNECQHAYRQCLADAKLFLAVGFPEAY
jgi:hypothetical protein